MTSGQKTALSLLISILIFGACLCFALLGGFNFLEIHFYEPRVVENTTQTLQQISNAYDEYEAEVKNALSTYVSDKSVQTYIERQVSTEEALGRAKATRNLFDALPGLEGVRIVESNGENLHFSSFAQDVKSENSELISYKNYTDLNELPFFLISVPDTGNYCSTKESYESRIGVYYDSAKERVIYSLPYFDHYTAFRGTAVFYVSSDDLMRELIGRSLVSLNTRCCLVSPMNADANYQQKGNSGLVFNIPYSSRSQIKTDVLAKWEKGLYGVEQLLKSNSDDDVLVLVSSRVNDSMSLGWILFESDFTFSASERFLILLCVFITVFLVVFLMFNLKHDDMVVIRGRVHKFHMALLSEYLERHDNADWATITKDLNYRKVDVNEELKRSLGRRGKKYSKELDELLDESWNDFFNAVGGVSVPKKIRVEEEKKSVDEERSSSVSAEEPVMEVISEVEDLEEIEEISDAEPVEELEEVSDAEPVEELEEISEAEPVEELEEISDAEPVEELEEVSDAEPVEELEEISDAEPVEELEEISDAEPVEDVEEAVDAVPEAVVPSLNEEHVVPGEKTAVRKTGLFARAQSVKISDEEIAEVPGLVSKKDVQKDEAFVEGFEVDNLDFSSLDENMKNESEEN